MLLTVVFMLFLGDTVGSIYGVIVYLFNSKEVNTNA